MEGGTSEASLQLELDPSRVDHTMDWLRRRDLSPRQVSFAAVLIFAVFALLGAMISGAVGDVSDLKQAGEDIKLLLPRMTGDRGGSSFPLLRDFASWGIVVGLGMYMGHTWRQFLLMSDVFPSLINQDAIRCPPENLEAVRDQFKRAQDQYEALRGSVLLPILAWIAGAGVTAGAARNGVFSRFVEDTPNTPGDAYEGWWAQVSNLGGYVSYITIGILSTYFIVATVLAATILLRLAYKVRNLLEFRLNYAASDRFGGWRAFYDLVGSVPTAFALALFSLGCIALQLSVRSMALAIVLLALFVISNPIFFYGPQRIMRGRLEKWSLERREQLGPIVASGDASAAEVEEFRFLGDPSNLPRFRIDWRSIAYGAVASLAVWVVTSG